MRQSLFGLVIVVSVAACVADEPELGVDETESSAFSFADDRARAAFIKELRSQLARHELRPMPAPVIPGTAERRAALIELGRALVFDRILSDNQDVACMTCHVASIGTDDDRVLSSGVRGVGLGETRTGGVTIARNSPPLWNLHGLDSMFWDGRVERLADGRWRTPAGAQLTPAMTAVFELGAVSAVGMFPVASREEMRELAPDGRFDDLSRIADHDFTGLWNALMNRLRAIPRYRELFGDAYPSWPGSRTSRIDTMTFAHASNAMAAYLVATYTSADTPWDRFLAGDNRAFRTVEELTAHPDLIPTTEDVALHGAALFVRECAMCHSGPFLTDHRFHNTAVVQLGPGLGDGPSGRGDLGRGRVVADSDPEARCGMAGSGDSCRHAFRTPPLRNAVFTGPYGHAGQFGQYDRRGATFTENLRHDINDLRGFVFHYAGRVGENLMTYNTYQLAPELRETLVDNRAEILADMDSVFGPTFEEGEFQLSFSRIEPMTAFMLATTSLELVGKGMVTGSPARLAPCGAIPATVPSGLPVDGSQAEMGDCQ